MNSSNAIHRIRTIDAHAAGEPLRLIVDGFPRPQGRTMLDKRAWVKKHNDWIRRGLMFEPRGHINMYGAVLTEPVEADSHTGILFMHNEGYSTMCGHGIVAVTTIAIERELLFVAEDQTTVVFDSPAGPVRARATLVSNRSTRRVESVSFVNVPSFVLHPGVTVKIAGREVSVDVAFGGAFYAIVDTEAAGLPLSISELPQLRQTGMEIKYAVEAAVRVAHPFQSSLEGIYGTIFTGVAESPDADLRNVTIFADAQVDRSPCGTGTGAVMAVLDAMGLIDDDRPFVNESLLGTVFRGRVVERVKVGDYSAIVPEIEGSAWITGEHTFIIDENDPLRSGFIL